MISKETAVIFIEFQNEFCKEGGKFYPLVKPALEKNRTIENGVRLLALARERGARVIFCPFHLDKDWVEHSRIEGLVKGLDEGEIFVPGTWGAQIIEEMKPEDGEVVLEGKRALSAFSHTNLDSLLRFGKIENVIVCGFLTNVCVQATAWSAYDRGWKVRIITEACGALEPEFQRYVEEVICPMFGGKLSIDELAAQLR